MLALRRRRDRRSSLRAVWPRTATLASVLIHVDLPEDLTRLTTPLMERRNALRAISGLSIALNAISAGSIFVFPIYAPIITRRLSLGMRQTNAVAVGAIVAEYLSSPFWGQATDKQGPRLVSLSAAVLFAAGYGLMARALRDDPTLPGNMLSGPWQSLPTYARPPDWIILAIFYVLSGTATSASYFAAVSTAAKTYPKHGGLAIAIPCALFGISPLLLSSIAASGFTNAQTDDLNVHGYLTFLAVALFAINALGALCLRVLPDDPSADNEHADPTIDETTALMPKMGEEADRPQTVRQLLSDPAFWSLGAILMLITGPAEMIQASLGSIVEALILVPKVTGSMPPVSALRLRATHVQVISLFNTCTRVVAGAASDWLAPTPGRRRRKWSLSRLVLIAGAALGFAAACLYVAIGLKQATGPGLWVLSISTGIAYGLVFTLTPAIVAIVWPLSSFGRNWGIVSYFSALGSVIYASLYGVLADAQTRSDGMLCSGSKCFRATFWVCAGGAFLAFCLALSLVRRRDWKGRV